MIYTVRHRSGFFETTPCYLIIDSRRGQLLLLPCQAPFQMRFLILRDELEAVVLSVHQHHAACDLFTRQQTHSLLFPPGIPQEEIKKEFRSFGTLSLKIETLE
ncbi:hypothetical protein [Anoxynatronum buryatiense]|uniref:Uncharacterized protein n=1 Tax=Anoxynatronum buryatiense TaxID=489973 RepID=A0AA45WUY2_9CLOT|nr:hypothetical protein [Anoxynatronum buryatiense]SMP50943.1 hypothetical protein SAMN06296020_10439 [Anoxynatronum buryatiense]